MSDITVILPGSSYRIAKEGSPGESIEEALRRATLVKRGRGHQAIVTLSLEDASELAEYFFSVAGVVGDMSSDERAGGSEHRAAHEGMSRLDAALRAFRA